MSSRAGFAVLLLVAAFSLPNARSAVASPALTWAPPSCGDDTHRCVDLSLSNTGANQTPSLNASDDYRIHLPAVPLEGGLQIRGGHNVIIVGGQIDLAVPCSDASSACHGINIAKPTSGEVFIEGVWIHDPQDPITQSTGDGIDVGDPAGNASDITLQNVRIDGISGCSGGADHADIFQPYAVPGAHVHIDRLTGTTNCQGMTLDPDVSWSTYGQLAAEYTIKNANVNVFSNPYNGDANRYAWWLTDGGAQGGCLSGPLSLTNTYAQEPDGTLRMNSVWPDTDQPDACRSAWNPPTLSFPNSPQIRGVVTAGRPPGGDYVPQGLAGLGYRSPGYLGPSGTVGGNVPPTLALTIDAPASLGVFVPGVDATYTTQTTAHVISTAGDATLSVSGAGRLTNGAFALAEPIQVRLSKMTWAEPVSNDPVTITFQQHIGGHEALRTGTYTGSVTFTLSTTAP